MHKVRTIVIADPGRLSVCIEGLHSAQNNEAKWHSAVRCYSVNKRCFVMCAWKMRIIVLFVAKYCQI